MYIPVQKKDKDFSNFLQGLFTKEETFGDRVAADIEAMKKATTKTTMSKTTKALLTVGVVALIGAAGFVVYKKLKK